jgi:hypothetical protein
MKTKSCIEKRPRSAGHLSRMSIGATNHNQRLINTDLTTAESPSNSPNTQSRSISPAASTTNFIRPISPPCIQVKEPLSPKFARAFSTTMHCSAAAATTTVASPTQKVLFDGVTLPSAVPENCFEPENYRNLSPLNSNQQKKLSFSDPTLNQTTKSIRHAIITRGTTQEHRSISSLHQHRLIADSIAIQSDNNDEEEQDEDENNNNSDVQDDQSHSSDQEINSKDKASSSFIQQTRKVGRHRSHHAIIH